MQTMLIVATIFLGYNLFFGNKGPEDLRTSAEIFTDMRQQNQEIKDYSIAANLQKLKSRLDSEVGNKRTSAQEAEKLKFEAAVLVIDTQYKAAVQRKDIQRISMAQSALTSLRHEFDKKPIWNEAVAVASHKDFPDTSLTAGTLREKVNAAASSLGKNTQVWGFFPGYEMIDAIVHLTGAIPAVSYALACLLLAVAVRLIVWPLTQKQYMWSRQMAQLTPLVNEIKEEYKGKPALQQEMNLKVMGLYKEYGMNPMAGCMPALLQMPLFLIVYQSMLHYKYDFQNGTFLWVNSSFGQASNGLIASNLGERDYIMIILYGISMVITTLIAPVSDPANAKQQKLMGIGISLLFTLFMFTGAFPVPAAFVLYWIFTNIVAQLQALRAYRLPLPPLVKVNAPNGGVFPGPMSNGAMNGKSTKTGVPQRHRPKKKK